MPSCQLIVVSALTGMLVAGGWWVFVDGALTAPDTFPWFHIVPAFGIMISMTALNLVSANQLMDTSGFYEGTSGPVKLWVFSWFTIGMVCIGTAIWITAVEYPTKYNWPGVTIILQTMMVFSAGTLFFIGQRPLGGGGGMESGAW